MAISRKPKTQDPSLPTIDVEALIAKGGSIAQIAEIPNGGAKAALRGGGEEEKQPEKEVTSFTLRVPGEILETLDAHRKKQVYKVPRQQWILEAIMQRLEREMLPHAPHD